jgi:uncharacterized membrane protein
LPSTKEAAVTRILGLVLIALGGFAVFLGGFTYTTQERIVDIGPIHATREQTHNVPLTLIGGAMSIIGGVVVLVAGKKKNVPTGPESLFRKKEDSQ